MIVIYVQKTQARAELDAPVTSGSIGRGVEFRFSDDWAGLTKTAIFETDNYKDSKQIPESGVTTIPDSVLEYPGFQLRVGVYGRSAGGDVVTPTVYADCGTIKRGANTTPVGTPPTPSQAEALQKQIDVLSSRFDVWVAPGELEDVVSVDFTPVNLGDTATGKIASNGTHAIVTLTSSISVNMGAGEELEIATIPEGFEPVTNGFVPYNAGKFTTLKVKLNGGKVYLVNDTEENVATGKLPSTATFAYALANPNITELTDIRVGYDGTTYETAGDAVREQINEAMRAASTGVSPDVVKEAVEEYLNEHPVEGGTAVYVQNHEPVDAPDGALWVNPDENDYEEEADEDGWSSTPRLTDEQKAELKGLMDSYYSNRTMFCYDWAATRNYYANNRCWVPEFSKFRMCCTTFVEMLWMGRAVSDFKDKDGSTYSNAITPAFDWGYYFQYNDRKHLGGVTRLDDEGNVAYYKYKQPLGEDKYSYSVNTVYDADYVDNASYPHAQVPKGFMMANDMAKELYLMGCEIPFSELEQGDLVFIGDKWDESVNEHLFFQNTRFRGISHVAMVYKITDGVVMLIDCTDDAFDTKAGAGLPILLCREDHSSEMFTRARAIYMLGNVAMCARHPAAWGKDNMAERGNIDHMPLAQNDGGSLSRAIPLDFTAAVTVESGLWYVYDNKVGLAKTTDTVTAWDEIEFETLYE